MARRKTITVEMTLSEATAITAALDAVRSRQLPCLDKGERRSIDWVLDRIGRAWRDAVDHNLAERAQEEPRHG